MMFDYSCYSNRVIKMRDMWNHRHPDVKIKTKDEKKIWNKLAEYLGMFVIKKLVGLRVIYLRIRWIEKRYFHQNLQKVGSEI